MNKKILIISLFVLVFLCLKKINSFIIIWQLQGFSLFIVLFHIGQYIMLTKVNIIFRKINNISFSIYLFHHIIIYDVLSINNPTEWYLHLFLLLITILLTIICAKIHSMVGNSITNSPTFKKLESLIFIL